jgi:hypothetical protein
VEVWLTILRDAKSYEEWEEAAFQLDVLLGNDLWYGLGSSLRDRVYIELIVFLL